MQRRCNELKADREDRKHEAQPTLADRLRTNVSTGMPHGRTRLVRLETKLIYFRVTRQRDCSMTAGSRGTNGGLERSLQPRLIRRLWPPGVITKNATKPLCHVFGLRRVPGFGACRG